MTEKPNLAIDLGIHSVPTVVLFKGDRVNLDSSARFAIEDTARSSEPIHRMFDRFTLL